MVGQGAIQMSRTDYFERAMDFVLKWEGGYVHHPDDPGGETNFGISKRAYPHLDIKGLTEAGAKEIYRMDYWEAAGCDDGFDWPMCLVVFDTAVNMGVMRALRLVEESPDWKDYSKKPSDWRDYIMQRIELYTVYSKNPKNLVFLRGWLNRVLDLYRVAKGG